MENIKFESALDVAVVLKEKQRLRGFLAEFFDMCNALYNKSEGEYIPIIRNEKTNYYNVDFDLLIYSFLMFLESENLDKNTLANAKYVFDKINPMTARKSTIFLLNVLTFHGVTGQSKSGFFYMSSLNKKIGSEGYFQFNSVGINRVVLLELFGPEFEENFIIPIAGNNKNIQIIGLGPKAINSYKKSLNIKDENVLTSAHILRNFSGI